MPDWPTSCTAPTDLPAVMRKRTSTWPAEAAVAAGDDVAVALGFNNMAAFARSAARVTIAGAKCGDPTRAANAALNVPVPDAWQLRPEVGLGMGEPGARRDGHRVDPDTGEELAMIDVGTYRSRSSRRTAA